MLTDNTPFPPSSFETLAMLESDNWWFRSRNRIILWALETKIKSFKSLLEVGCGTGFVLKGIHDKYPTASLFAVEYYSEGIEHASKRVPTAKIKQLDATKMNEIGVYDVVASFDVVEHIPDDVKALNNFYSALKEGGSLILTVPQHPSMWSKSDDFAGHIRRYTRSELLDKVRNSGFTVNYISSFVTFLLPLMWISRLAFTKKDYYPMSEFLIPKWLNKCLEFVMGIEYLFLKIGLVFPAGGSLLLVAHKGK